MDTAIGDRAARGALLLDRLQPGWAERIATDNLAMDCCDRCILGQLFGGYWAGYMLLSSTCHFSPVAHGFTLPDEDQQFERFDVPPWVPGGFKVLAEAWRSEVRSRIPDPATT